MDLLINLSKWLNSKSSRDIYIEIEQNTSRSFLETKLLTVRKQTKISTCAFQRIYVKS